MLKSLQRYAVLNKVDDGIFVSLRQINRKMYRDQKQQNQNQKYFNDNDSNNLSKFRKWITVTPQPMQPGFAFSVLNYNILSQQLLDIHSHLYQSNQTQALRWNRRFYNLVGEILANNPDIMCCQVRNSTVFFSTFIRQQYFMSLSFIYIGSAIHSPKRYSNSSEIAKL